MNKSTTKEDVLEAYKKMFLIRRLEEDLVKHYYDNKIMSFVHFYIGQEAVAVGVCNNLRHEDFVLGNHRSHGHYLAKGGDPNKMVAELLGKETGCCRGIGGSMHMIDKSVNFLGSTPILGSVVPISAGVALTQKLQNTGKITVAFFGDGASEEGVVYETINFAALFKLPLLLVIENNLYSVMSKLEDRRSKNHDLEKIVTGFGAKYIKADGNNYFSVSEATNQAIDTIKNRNQPVVLECITFRHMAHSAPIRDDNLCYREKDTPDARSKHDSVVNLRKALLQDYAEEYICFLEDDINRVCREAIEFGVKSAYPSVDQLEMNVYHD